MAKKTDGGKAKTSDTRPKPRLVAPHKPIEQKMWRRAALLQRALDYKLTDKNRLEAERMGLTLT